MKAFSVKFNFPFYLGRYQVEDRYHFVLFTKYYTNGVTSIMTVISLKASGICIIYPIFISTYTIPPSLESLFFFF
jgi:hypothetical protein